MKTHKYVIFLLFFLFFIFAFFLWEFKSINVNNRQNVDAVETTARFSKNLNQLRFELLKLDNNLFAKGNPGSSRYLYEFRSDSASLAKLFNDPSFTRIRHEELNKGILLLRQSVDRKLARQSAYLFREATDTLAGAGFTKQNDEINKQIGSQLMAVNNLQQKIFAGEIGNVEQTYTKQYLIALGFAILSFLVFYFLLTGLNSHIQRRKIAEEEALINEVKYKRIIDESGAIIFTTNMEGRFTFVNEQASRVTGYHEDELLGKSFLELVDPGWRDQLIRFYEDAIRRSLVETQIRFPAICKNGETRWMEQTAVLVTRQGVPAGFHCITKDITESYQLENEKKYLYQLFQSIMDNSPQVIFIKSTEGRYIHANKQFCELLGLPETAITGKTDAELFGPGHGNHYRQKEMQVIKNKVPCRLRQNIAVKNSVRTFSVELFPLFDFNEQVLGVSGIATDITDTVLNQKNLITALKRAETAEKHTQSFLANMSHEIRTPLNSIIGLSYQLLKSDMRPKEHGFVRTIHAASEHLLVLINDILDTSKIEAGKLTLDQTHFSFREIIQLMVDLLRQKAEEKNIRILTEIDSNLFASHTGDPHRIKQILLNLLTNAVKFTPGGLIRIICKVEKEGPKDQSVSISVIDSGIGIEQEYIDRIFTKFSQEDKSTTRNYGGTGLGMFITKSLVELMGGSISVTSQKEIGTHVKISLTLPKNLIPVIRLAAKPSVSTPSLGNLHVLVVDDNEMNRLVASTVLENHGIKVSEAINGAEAVRLLQSQVFDLVLMDLQMPVMDGLQAAAKIRKELGLKVPIIALTASALNEESHRCLDAGMNDFIIKPFKEEEMVDVLLRNLRQPLPGQEDERKVS
ncbi:MAG: PAS domain S-box protein [Sphingobacteriales bacterium]|nr:PAS domain S-box protein [Sphingobacteriales bacterium]